MAITVYAIPISNPANAVRAMVTYKGLRYRLVKFPPGFHPWLMPAVGFAGRTVPGMDVDGVKVQTSLSISRTLDELEPRWPLFPSDPGALLAVEEAEAWGDSVLQPLPRRIFRWALTANPALRRWLSGEVMGLPLPAVGATLSKPVSVKLAGMASATADAARADVAALPGVLDHVDALIADGVIGDPATPNAADFQILATVRSLGLIVDLEPILAGRPSTAAAARVFPFYDGRRGPSMLPADWVTAG